jgi:phage terminase large subunit
MTLEAEDIQAGEINAEFPEKLAFLFEPHRYKVLYGGRGGSKSWGIARALLILGAQRPLRILCARETMKSISESVHRLLADQIRELGLGDIYTIEKAKIFAGNGTEITFAGLRHNVSNIKSLEGCDVVWVEEAQNVSRDSWDTLIPTLRKDGSEIWVSFNPDLATDDTYRRFVLNPNPAAAVVRIGWQDNPWFPAELRKEMQHLRDTDPERFEHVYEGACKSSVEGAIYRAEIAAAEKDGRITRVTCDRTRPVDTYWDLGYGDMVSIWFGQSIAFELRFVDYYQNSRQSIDFYLQVLQSKGYVLGTCVLPWDGGAKTLGTGRSIEELMRAKGFKVRVLPQLRVSDGINAVRTVFPQMWFDGERCADGLNALRRYQWGPPSASGVAKREPLHDDASHPADALRCAALFRQTPEKTSAAARHTPVFRSQTYTPFA